jgi:transposase InsO family protein
MPWTETVPMTERFKFILAYDEGLFSMTELCRRFGISRKTGYKWRDRYRDGGLDGLRDRSRAPLSCPHQTDPAVADLVIGARRARPTWGPRKLRAYLEKQHPAVTFPAPSTIGDLLKREGLIGTPHRSERSVHPGVGAIDAPVPGAVWTADFKGEFRLGDGPYCYPLTLQDACSRYLLACTALPSTAHEGARPVFEQAFRTWGLPDAIRTDNGAPFVSKALCGLSQLSVWWIQLGIHPERIRPGCPGENGRHERMHRTLKAETTRPPAPSAPAQQRRFDAFQTEFNTVRPHQALGDAVPASRFAACSRPMPDRVPEPNYPGYAEVRTVSAVGTVKFARGGLETPLFISSVLAGHRVAFTEVDDGVWSLHFHDVLLARLDQRTRRLSPGSPF